MQKMTDDEYRSFLMAETRTGKLATVRADGSPHVAPVWYVLDGDDLVFMTQETTVKAKNIKRDGRVAISVDDEKPPFAFVMIEGNAAFMDVSSEEQQMWATRIGGRYMGADRAEEFGKRNAVPGELVIRVHVTKVVAIKDMSA